MPYQRWRGILFAVLIAGLLAGCQSLTPKVSGRVVDAESGAAVPQAEIRVLDDVYEADASGRYALYLGAGEFAPTFWSPGYVMQTAPVVLGRWDLRHVMDIALTPRQLLVTALDERSGQPVASARLQWGEVTAETDLQGAATMRVATDQPLNIAADGYREAAISAEQLTTLLAAEEASTPLAVSLTPRTLAGRVLDAITGEGVAGATVSLGEISIDTAADGVYELAYLPAKGALMVAASGYREPEAVVYDGEETLELTLEPWLAEVTVLDTDLGQPVPEAMVSVAGITAVADAQGLALVRAEPGAMLDISADGYHSGSAAFSGEPLTVQLKPSRLVVILTDSGTGQPLANARVIVYPREGEPDILHSDDRGHVDIADALQFERLLVKQPGYRLVEATIDRMGRLDLQVEPFEARGIYIPFGLLALPDRVEALLDMVAESELNMVTVDVKGDWSYLAWDSPNPVAREIGAFSPEKLLPLPDLLRMCQERDIYVVARLVVFKDDNLAKKKPDWAVKKADGSLYVDGEGLHWVDPFRQDVRDYMIALAVEIAEMGFDEVQYDYVRFPSDGSTKYLEYEKEAVFENRTVLMAEFFHQAQEALAPTRAFFSGDVFGLVVWMDADRDMGIGQRMEDIAPFVDYICPMLYPQTFGSGNLGYVNPQLYPYEVLFRSVRKANTRTDTLVRAWLQHYSLGVDYGLRELLAQRKGAEDAQGAGWTYWNAAGKYNRDLFVPDPYAQIPGLPTPDDVD
jgi:hypothetical protein